MHYRAYLLSVKQKIYSAIYKATFGSGTSLYEAVNFITDLDLIKVTGRKAVVLFTDGVDTTSREATFESTLNAVQEVDALVYPIRYNTLQTGGVVSASTGAAARRTPHRKDKSRPPQPSGASEIRLHHPPTPKLETKIDHGTDGGCKVAA